MTLNDILTSTIILSITVITSVIFVYFTGQLSLVWGEQIIFTMGLYFIIFLALALIFAKINKRG